MKIWDCRKKEYLTIEKRSGDLEIKVVSTDGHIVYVGWYQMKQPWMKTYREIQQLFKEIQKRLERQDEE
ncbi:MAG: hypothetical protein QXP56_04585 [Archaeoglobaceae archaeon]